MFNGASFRVFSHRARNAGFDAQRFVTVPAGEGKTDQTAVLNIYSWRSEGFRCVSFQDIISAGMTDAASDLAQAASDAMLLDSSDLCHHFPHIALNYRDQFAELDIDI